LTYHTTAEEARRAATSQSEQQGKDVLDKMATTLSAVGPSIVTEVEFATLREKNKGLRRVITMGCQAVNEAYEGKRASEIREKEQSRRFDKLIDEVAEAMKPPAPAPQSTPPRNTGPDLNVVMTKWLQANQSYIDEQRKVVEKEGELQQKSLVVVNLQDKLKSLQAEYDTCQARLNSLEGAQGDADASMQRNISLQSQLEKSKAASIEAAKVPALIQDLAARDEEIRELTPKASKVPALDRELAARAQEINKLKPEAARVSLLSQELAAKDQEISKWKSEAAKVSALNELLAVKDREINKLKSEASRVPALRRELTVRDQEISKLKPEAWKVPVLTKELTARNQEIKKLKPEAAKVHELIPKLVATEGELAKLQPLASQIPDLVAKVTAKEDELKELRPKAEQISVLAEKLSLRDTEIAELRPNAAQCDAKSSHNTVLELEATGHKASIQSLEQQLTTVKNDAESLQKVHAASKAEIAKSQKTIVSLQTELKKSQRSAQQVEVLQKEIVTLIVNFEDHQQLNESLKAQQSANIKHASHIDELQSKLEEEQKLSSQIPALQEEIQQLSQKYGKLGRKLVEAKSVVEKVKALETGIQQKDQEISVLRTKLQKTEEVGRQLESVQHESQQKTAQLATLQEQTKKLQVDSQRLSGLQEHQTQILDEEENEFPTQQTMLELAEMLNREEVSNMQQSCHSSSTRPDMPQRKRADRTGQKVNEESPSFRKTHDREIQKTQKDPRKHAGNVDGSQQIPDSQPQTSARQRDLQNILATSSPLSDLLAPAAHAHGVADAHGRHKDLFGSSPPFGSSGGEGMLLEAFEGIESTLRESRVETVRQQTDRPQPQQSSQKQQGYGRTASRTIVVNGTAETGRHQLRSGMSSQVIPDSQSQEQRLPTPNLALSSPAGAGVTKHLPNSTAKRPRLDSIEVVIPSKTNRKKLKRTPANLDVRKTPGKRPMSSGTQATDSGCANKVSLPSGSRKGSVIGANAPIPGNTQGRTRASRKGSKSDRYAERFNHE
jgi:predicted RNase H-like nuclease (RuvC/YqgF family)